MKAGIARRGALVVVAAALGAGLVPSAADAARVLKVQDGKARWVRDPLLPPASKTALPPVRGKSGPRVATTPRARAASLTGQERKRYSDALSAAKRQRDALSGTRRAELSAVIAIVERIESRGELTSSRLNAIESTLRRNTELWGSNAAPPPGTHVTFGTSPVIFEYYAGSGLQIQPLGNFGKANAAWSECRSVGDRTCTRLRNHLDAMLSLAAQRGGFTAFEYYFDFEGGAPPWISSMAQGTGIQALSRATQLTDDTRYFTAARAALGAFETAPPVGVLQPAEGGSHYLMYSYAPRLFIFNGFLQSLVGLDDYRDISGDARGTTLFRNGHAHAKLLVPQSDTGSWSLYSLGGPESTRNYHVLLRDILANLCKRIGTTVYCTTADRFTQYLAARDAA